MPPLPRYPCGEGVGQWARRIVERPIGAAAKDRWEQRVPSDRGVAREAQPGDGPGIQPRLRVTTDWSPGDLIERLRYKAEKAGGVCLNRM